MFSALLSCRETNNHQKQETPPYTEPGEVACAAGMAKVAKDIDAQFVLALVCQRGFAPPPLSLLFFFLIVLFVVLPCNNCLSSLNIPSTVLFVLSFFLSFVLSFFPCFNFSWGGGALCDRVTTFTLTAFKVTRTTFASAPHLKTCTPATACRSRFMSWPATTTIVEMSLRRSSTQSTQLDGPCPTRTTHGASPLTTATVATPPLIS